MKISMRPRVSRINKLLTSTTWQASISSGISEDILVGLFVDGEITSSAILTCLRADEMELKGLGVEDGSGAKFQTALRLCSLKGHP